MSVLKVDPTALTITMDNKDNKITLGANKDIPLMGRINIYAADQNEMSDADPLRYSIYKSVSFKGETATVIKVVPEKAEVNSAHENATHEVAQTVENQTTRAYAAEDAQKIAAEPEATQKNSTLTMAAIKGEKSKKLPGFMSAFAIAGLLSLAYILFGRERQRNGK
jgi:hypothetical protein